MHTLIYRDIYELSYDHSQNNTPITWVKIRWRIRKFGIKNNINIICDNTQDVDGRVRFGILHGEKCESIVKYINSILRNTRISIVLEKVWNPVLSKIKCNDENRYEL